MDLRQFHREDVFSPSLGDKFECQGQMSKVKVTTDKNRIFGRYLGNR